MASFDFHEVEQFASLFKAGECPPFPQTLSDLPNNVTVRETIKSKMPNLWQRLHGEAHLQLPADVMVRYHQGKLVNGDQDQLRAVGMEVAANELDERVKAEFIAEQEKRWQEQLERQAEAAEAQKAAAEIARLESEAVMHARFRAEATAQRGW